jgi:hypothetical protein
LLLLIVTQVSCGYTEKEWEMKRKRAIFTLFMGLVITACAPLAQAAYVFSYENAGGDVLSGILDGTLQADNDRIVVTGISDLRINGNGLFDIGFVESFQEFNLGIGPLDPVVRVSGNFMDLIACPTPSCNDGFLFLNVPPTQSVADSSFGFFDASFETSHWSISQVPVPAAVWLFGSGLLGLVGVALKRGRSMGSDSIHSV